MRKITKIKTFEFLINDEESLQGKCIKEQASKPLYTAASPKLIDSTINDFTKNKDVVNIKITNYNVNTDLVIERITVIYNTYQDSYGEED